MDEQSQNDLVNQNRADRLPPLPQEPVSQKPEDPVPPPPPALEPPAPAPPPPVVEQQNLAEPTAVEPQAPAPTYDGGQSTAPVTPGDMPKKSSALGWILGIIIVLALGGGGYYYYITKIKTSPTANSTSSTSTAEVPAKSAIETTYDNATATVTASDKGRAADIVLLPVFQKTFNNGVKLTSETTILTYTLNRAVVATDVTSVKTQLETAGYKATLDSAGKQLTVTKDTTVWTISFSIGFETKAIIEVKF